MILDTGCTMLGDGCTTGHGGRAGRVSYIEYPVSCILHRASCIQYPVSSIYTSLPPDNPIGRLPSPMSGSPRGAKMKWFARAGAALLLVLLAPITAQAVEKVAVLPVQILDADPGNGERMTEAL